MPRFVRNFWARVTSDARKKPVETGPLSSGGGIDVEVLLREAGEISDYRIEIDGRVFVNGSNTSEDMIGARVSLVHGRTEVLAFHVVLPKDAGSKEVVRYTVDHNGVPVLASAPPVVEEEKVEVATKVELPKREGYWQHGEAEK